MPLDYTDEPLNQTGFLYRPHYLDVGDLRLEEYDLTDPTAAGYIPPEQIFMGDLDNQLSFSELIDLSRQERTRAGIRTEWDRPDRTTVLDAVQRAEGTIDGYLAKRYTVPVLTSTGTVPRDVYKYALGAFKYEMYSEWKTMPGAVEVQYQKVLAWLLNIAKGLVVIPELIVLPDGSEQTTGADTHSIIGEVYTGVDIFGTRRFTRDQDTYTSEHARFDH